MRFIRCLAFATWGLLSAAPGLTAHEVADEMAEAAQRFLASLGAEQRAAALFAFDHSGRTNWHFIPRDRQGVSLLQLEPAQRHLAMGLLGSALSQRGLLKATTIMSLESVLQELERGTGPVRDPERYYVTVFGAPAARGTWGWRFEGHHLSLNFTIIDGEVQSVTPSMFGANPAEVREGPRQGLRVLAAEQDLALELMRSLSPSQRSTALLPGSVPADILLTPDRDAVPLQPAGLCAKDLEAPQRELLWRLIQEYVRRYRPELADEDLRKIREKGHDQIHFAWAGGTAPGEGHYYRVQGPTFVMEYDNTQNGANHIHTTWRDIARDFGRDPLREHYERSPHHRKP